MNYVRIDYKGNFSPIHDALLIKTLAGEQGNVLVVTGKRERSRAVFEDLKTYSISGIFSATNMEVGTLLNKIHIRSSLDWWDYSGMQLRCAYITRGADLNFLLQIMSRCKSYPNLLPTSNIK